MVSTGLGGPPLPQKHFYVNKTKTKFTKLQNLWGSLHVLTTEIHKQLIKTTKTEKTYFYTFRKNSGKKKEKQIAAHCNIKRGRKSFGRGRGGWFYSNAVNLWQ